MTRRSKIWRLTAWAYVLINALGAGYAFGMNERMHGTLHLVLLFAGFAGYAIWRMASSQRGEKPLLATDPRVEYLQQSVDAIALEVERIGEAQRYNEKLRVDRPEAVPPKKEQ
jgi:hypothetical protein